MRPCLHVGSVVQVSGSLLFIGHTAAESRWGRPSSWPRSRWAALASPRFFFFPPFLLLFFFPPFETLPLFLWRLTSSVTR